MSDETQAQQSQGLKTPEPDELAKTWKTRIEKSRKHWKKFHKRVKHNRKVVSGFDWKADPESEGFYKLRANLIQGTITSVLPAIYARNPEISVSPNYTSMNLKLFCKTLEKVTNVSLEKAKLKTRAKSSVRAALTASFGVVKVMYQRDMQLDPIIQGRINDTQDNIAEAERLLADVRDPEKLSELESKRAELEQIMSSLREKVEVTAAEGLVIDRVLTEHLLIDDTVAEFWDYQDAGWIAQIVPMKRSDAEATYKVKLDKATAYKSDSVSLNDGRLASATSTASDDAQIAVIEIWDKNTQRIYTTADGCEFWLREPYSPTKTGERWYPFFLLPFQTVDGEFVAPSLVDLTEKLQAEHNDARDKFNRHRDLCKPGWIAGGQVDEKSIKRYTDSEIGEITIVDTNGMPLTSFIAPRQHPPIDPVVYDTSAVRYDWEQVTGMQDAARSSVVQPKTATEASILQQSLSGRVSEFRDQVEDWLQEIAQYAAQILILELTPPQVERIMGPHKTGTQDIGGIPVEGIVEKSYDWPQLSREEVFDMVQLKIRAGTTGAPDKTEQQEVWTKILPVIQGIVSQIMQIQATGQDAEPLKNLLKETLKRFDERLEIEDFLPKPPLPIAENQNQPQPQPQL